MTREQQPGAEEPSANHELRQPEQANPAERPEFASPEIWVGSLSDYNNGDLYGLWMDAARSADEVHADIKSMLARGPAAQRGEASEEWGIFDHEGFGSVRISEYESIEDVARIARAVAEYGPAFTAYIELGGLPLSEITSEGFREAYADSTPSSPTPRNSRATSDTSNSWTNYRPMSVRTCVWTTSSSLMTYKLAATSATRSRMTTVACTSFVLSKATLLPSVVI